jgi:acyl-CoA thioesterase-1
VEAFKEITRYDSLIYKLLKQSQQEIGYHSPLLLKGLFNMTELLKFVAFGDSLTVGFIPSRIATQPYSRFLKEMVDDFLKQLEKNSDFEVRFINRGVNGDLTSGMLLRFRQDVIQLNPKYVIILGGTNDIGWGVQVEEVFLNLKRMYEMALNNKIKPIGCTVPSILGGDEGIPPRVRLNKSIKQYCREKGVLLADLYAKTCNPKTKRLRSEYSSDGLHFNALGYRKIAESIFNEAVKGILPTSCGLGDC